jgi:hypothetical protein
MILKRKEHSGNGPSVKSACDPKFDTVFPHLSDPVRIPLLCRRDGKAPSLIGLEIWVYQHSAYPSHMQELD